MKNRNLVIVILAVICAGLLAGVVYTVTKGKSGTQKKQEASAEAGADETESQSGIIEEDGKKYKLNPDIKTVLFMGVDKKEKADLGNNPGENGQSDSLNLLVLNKEEKTAQIIQISRDSMVGIDIYDVTGNRLMTENGQIALQYAYGDGAEESCRLTSEKVSELMYGVNVDSYFSLTLEGLVAATDAVGGITLTVPEDYTAVDPAFEKGAEVTLNGELDEKYVRKRDIEVLDSNNQRMERQSQFMDALIEKMQSIQSETEYLSLYQKLEDYMTTNMTADEMEELTDYKVAEDTVKVPGEIIEKDGHAQYLVDNKELCYHYLGDFDEAMVHLIEGVKNIQKSDVVEIWHNDGDQILAYRRKDLVFVFNFNPTRSFTDYGFLVPRGEYHVVLNTDSKEFGGFGFADDSVAHFTCADPLYAKEKKEWLKLYITARSAVVLKRQK